MLDRTEGRAIQRIVSAEAKPFVAWLPAKIEDPDEWEAEAQRVLAGNRAIDVTAQVVVETAKPVDQDPDLARELRKARPAAETVAFHDPTKNPTNPADDRWHRDRERALGRYPPVSKFDRN